MCNLIIDIYGVLVTWFKASVCIYFLKIWLLSCICSLLFDCSIEDVLQGMVDVGAALGMEAESQAAVRKLQDRVTAARAAAASMAPAKHGKVAFLEWMDPLFCGGHWTPQLIEMAGGTHPLNPPR